MFESPKLSVLVFYCCCNKLLRTWGAWTVQINEQLCRSEVWHRSHLAKPRVWWGCVPFWSLRGECFLSLSSSQRLACSLACGPLHRQSQLQQVRLNPFLSKSIWHRLLALISTFLKVIYFSITVDLWYYISFRYTTQWLDIYDLGSDHLNKSSAHPTPSRVINNVTIFPMLYFTSLWLFCNCQSALLNPFTFSLFNF